MTCQLIEVRKNLIKNLFYNEAPVGFEPAISCLLGRRFNQLSHGAVLNLKIFKNLI